MFQIDAQAEQTLQILNLLGKNTISPVQLGTIIRTLISEMRKTQSESKTVSAYAKTALDKAIKDFNTQGERLLKANETAYNKKVFDTEGEATLKIAAYLREAKKVLAAIKKMEFKDGVDGKKGEDGIDGAPGKDGSPDTAEEIAEKLNGLKEVLNWDVIKNKPEFNQTIVHEGGHAGGMETPLVDFTTGLPLPKSALGAWRVNQNGGGGSTTNFVDNEVVAGVATSWTLANTPIVGSVHLYANGQRLIPTTDYSISGATITTVLSWDAGTVLADYRK